MVCRFVAVDGGFGAHLLAELTSAGAPLERVFSPRHANLLLVVGPIGGSLVSALGAYATALPRPSRALVIGPSTPIPSLAPHLARLDELLVGSRQVPTYSASRIIEAALAAEPWPELVVGPFESPPPITIPLPPKEEREIATELVVYSLGPIQDFTAGPLRLLLVCDGDEVVSARVEAGYARRDVAQAMERGSWQEAMLLARQLDPLAPFAGQLAYVRAIEQLQSWDPPGSVRNLRESALALERALNHLWWLVRFGVSLADERLVASGTALAQRLAEVRSAIELESPDEWVAPQASPRWGGIDAGWFAALRDLADRTELARARFERDSILALRTRGIGALAADRLRQASVSGPVLEASEHATGDVRARLLVRLGNAALDLRQAAEWLADYRPTARHPASWRVPSGETFSAVMGPRGQIGLRLVSDGGGGPFRVEWQRPSASLLPVLGEILAGQRLSDLEVIVASLDLAMAEADG